MAFATATPDGAPSVRMVLLKGVDARGLVFFTNYRSRKARELEANPRAALVLHWEQPGRQVRVEGRVERTSPEESERYFATRPRGSRVAAWASEQSAPVEDRAALERRVDEIASRFADDVPRPEHWGGYRIVPDRFEFWQHRESRLHDRFEYARDGEGWRLARLFP